MLLAVDVDYRPDGSAVASGILFADWRSGTVEATFIRRIAAVQPYHPGRFFERELPCILAVLDALPRGRRRSSSTAMSSLARTAVPASAPTSSTRSAVA